MRDNALKVEDDIPVSDLLSHTPLHSIGSYKSIDASCQLGMSDILNIHTIFNV